jgi:sigma-B regulation protein RsbU (phosphoserine phosphatase)
MYVTIFLGWYDTRTGALRYANAGHPTPYRIDRSGRVTEFGAATGPLLGILDVERYSEGEGCLEVGDRLVLYTDGVTEACDPVGAFFGQERLGTLLSRCASMPVKRLCEIVAGEVDAFQAHRRQDDATLLALHRKA